MAILTVRSPLASPGGSAHESRLIGRLSISGSLAGNRQQRANLGPHLTILVVRKARHSDEVLHIRDGTEY